MDADDEGSLDEEEIELKNECGSKRIKTETDQTESEDLEAIADGESEIEDCDDKSFLDKPLEMRARVLEDWKQKFEWLQLTESAENWNFKSFLLYSKLIELRTAGISEAWCEKLQCWGLQLKPREERKLHKAKRGLY